MYSSAEPCPAVIVQIDDKSGRVFRYWVDHNHSVDWHDPTAHAEMSVIRKAARELNVTDLGHIRKEDSKLSQPSEWSHCVIYSSAEPCPMCMAAIYWAGIHYLVFSATRYDTAAPGVNWDETAVFEELKRPYAKMKTITVRQATTNNFLDGFNYYKRTFIKK
nr:nucleoside deaminase [Coxiella burnetii]